MSSPGHQSSTRLSSVALHTRTSHTRTSTLVRSTKNTTKTLPDMHQFDMPYWSNPTTDTSNENLLKLFNEIDGSSNGWLTYEQFRAGLKKVNGGEDIGKEAFDNLTKMVDLDQSQNISRIEFISAIRDLVNQHMSRVGHKDEPLEEAVKIDYGPAKYNVDHLTGDPDEKDGDKSLSLVESKMKILELEQKTMGELQECKEDKEACNVRWICVTGHNRHAINRLSKIYKLHHLEIEDALSRHEQTKVKAQFHGDRGDKERWEIIIRNINISTGTANTNAEVDIGDIALNQEQFTIFLIGNTVLTFQTFLTALTTLSVRKQIALQGSLLRRFGAHFLVFSLIDAIVDSCYHTSSQFNGLLQKLESSSYKNILHIQRQMAIYLDWSKPVLKCLGDLAVLEKRRDAQFLGETPRNFEHTPTQSDSLVENDFYADVDLEPYYIDSQDTVNRMVDQVNYLMSWCSTLKEDYRFRQGNKMNKVMYFLTVITAVFLPGQFLSGVYGMNFDVMPELHIPYAYYCFWGLAVASGVCIFCCFRKYERSLKGDGDDEDSHFEN